MADGHVPSLFVAETFLFYFGIAGNAMSKIVFDFAASEGNMCVLVSAQVLHSNARNPFCTVLLHSGLHDNSQDCITPIGVTHLLTLSYLSPLHCLQVESELAGLGQADRELFLADMGVSDEECGLQVSRSPIQSPVVISDVFDILSSGTYTQ